MNMKPFSPGALKMSWVSSPPGPRWRINKKPCWLQPQRSVSGKLFRHYEEDDIKCCHLQLHGSLTIRIRKERALTGYHQRARPSEHLPLSFCLKGRRREPLSDRQRACHHSLRSQLCSGFLQWGPRERMGKCWAHSFGEAAEMNLLLWSYSIAARVSKLCP